MIETSIIGSYAWPSWFFTSVQAMEQGKYGVRDIEETLDDAVDLAIRDQEDAGVDVISDGEMRRIGFFTAGFYGRLEGLGNIEPSPGASARRDMTNGNGTKRWNRSQRRTAWASSPSTGMSASARNGESKCRVPVRIRWPDASKPPAHTTRTAWKWPTRFPISFGPNCNSWSRRVWILSS